MNCTRCSKPIEKCDTCKQGWEEYIRKYGDVTSAPIHCQKGRWHYCESCMMNAKVIT